VEPREGQAHGGLPRPQDVQGPRHARPGRGQPRGHKRIAVLDDVITSGESALIAAEAAESYKAEVVRVLAVVDREQGAAQMFQQRGYPYTSLFSIGDLLPAQK
jgi:orotate phosphoribosyltransferase